MYPDELSFSKIFSKKTMNMFKQIHKSTLIVALGLFLITLYIATQLRFPEIDEIYFMDAPANLILNGGWKSHILWGQFMYQPLHAFCLVLWMFVFGVSHFAVCGFGVLIGFATCLLIVKYAKELHFIDKEWQEILIVVCFWALNTFTDYETFGRPDNLGMLITVYVVSCFLVEKNIPVWKTVLLGGLLISVGVYEVPVLALFFLYMIITSYNKKSDLIGWVKKGFLFLIGILFGESLVCLFYLFNESSSLITYIGYTFGMVSANASNTTSILQRFIEAYLSNYYITVIYLLSLLLLIIKRVKVDYFMALLILLLPAFMVLAGRFVPYYCWIYYIPMIVFIVSCLSDFKIFSISVTGLFVLTSIAFFGTQWNTIYGCQTQPIKELIVVRRECNDYFKKNKDIISRYNHVVLSEEQLYFDVVNTGAEVWFQYRKNRLNRADFYNYEAMDLSLDKNRARESDKYLNYPVVGSILRFSKKYEPVSFPLFPEEGICVYTCDYEKSTSLAFLEHYGYKYECLDEKGAYSIYSFSK